MNRCIDDKVELPTHFVTVIGWDNNLPAKKFKNFYETKSSSKYDESIGAVGTYFNDSGIEYSFDVYVNNQKVHSQNGSSEFAGFKTIILDKYVPVKSGDDFKVVFKNNAVPYQAFSRQHYIPGISLASKDNSSWTDMVELDKTVCLKVYTVED
ncbi:lectin like domain-containing protein [Methanobrevibacter sp.]|uniref:lectin like domain-containing protein n=1 Tax=Methanobrevibacter sp. TaxID=66852 RepID=UPI00386934AE